MIFEDSNPRTVYNKHTLLQSGNSRKIQHLVLTLPIGLLFLVFGPVTQHLQRHQFCNRNNSGANFYHENFNNFAKMRQARQGAVGLCKKILRRERIMLHFMLLRLSFRL